MSGRLPNSRSFAVLAAGAVMILASHQAARAGTPGACGEQNLTGEQLYEQYCTLCHGIDGRGDGPLAYAIKAVPPDLRVLSQNAGGVFPADRVAAIIRYGGGLTGHGSAVMPVWGKMFAEECGPEYTARTVAELRRYLETIQRK